MDTPADRDRCRCCRDGSWWRTSKHAGWVCATCSPPFDFHQNAAGYETVNLKLDWWETLDLVRDFPGAERMASKHVGQWMVDRHLETIPMVQWTVDDWQAFVRVMCRTYIEGILIERRDTM